MDENNYENIEQYKPLGAWAYLGYSLLYAIPIVGLIFVIINSFSNNNYNKRNHARSFLLIMVIGFILSFIVSLLIYSTAGRLTNNAVNSLDALSRSMSDRY